MARSQRNMSTLGSPKKKARRRADGDEGDAGSGHTKRSKNDAPETEDSPSQAMADEASRRRRSGRSGAGSGGRVLQLEKIGSALGLQSKRPRKATDLPDDAADNPCAPEKTQKGRREKGCNLPPPPYQSVPAPAPVFHQRASDSDRFGFYAPSPTANPPLLQPRPEYAATSVPQGAPRSVHPVASRGALSRQPSMAVIPSILDDESHNSESFYGNAAFQRVRTEISDHQIDPALLSASRTHSSNVPTSRSKRLNLDNFGSTAEATDCDTQDENDREDSNGDEEDEDGNEEDGEADGWGTTHRRQTAHPGFSQDHRPRDSIRHNSLPVEQEFEHSRDEAEDAAMEALRQPNSVLSVQSQVATQGINLNQQFHTSRESSIAESEPGTHGNDANMRRERSNAQFQRGINPSGQFVLGRQSSVAESELVTRGNDVNLRRERSNAQHQAPQVVRQSSNTRVDTRGDSVDVLDHHHRTNGRPSAPDPVQLVSWHDVNEEGDRPIALNEIPVQTISVEPRARAPRNSKKSKDDPISPDTLAFYPPVWKDFLEDAKRHCRIAHMLQNPFPSKSRDLKGSVTDSLLASVVEWTERGTKFEPGHWPENKIHMASLLLADISTWRSELKTVVLDVAPTAYGLNPPSNIPTQGRVQWVKTTATTLLSGSLFLRDGLDENGKTKNFAHPALQHAITEFFYLGSYRVADKRPDLFRQTIPIPCLVLVAAACNCALDGFAQNGSSKSMPHFSGKAYSSIYRGLLSIVGEVLNNAYHGPRLEQQLVAWAEEAWASLQQVDTNVQRHDHLRAVLD